MMEGRERGSTADAKPGSIIVSYNVQLAQLIHHWEEIEASDVTNQEEKVQRRLIWEVNGFPQLSNVGWVEMIKIVD